MGVVGASEQASPGGVLGLRLKGCTVPSVLDYGPLTRMLSITWAVSGQLLVILKNI